MYLRDEKNHLVDAEISLNVLDGAPCIVIESSGGANPARGVQRRNPGYNTLLALVLQRLATAGVEITKVVLDSKKVSTIPIVERTVRLDQPYPINLALVEIDSFRRTIQSKIALMHRDPSAKKGGNAQKRLRICLSTPISADILLAQKPEHVPGADMQVFAPSLTETEKEYIAKARLGQGQFRKDLFAAFDNLCAVTTIANADLLIASHIKPWKVCTNLERLDPRNGILLSAMVDRLFDKGLITFDSAGGIVTSPRLSMRDRISCGVDFSAKLTLVAEGWSYMEYHRAFTFKND